MSKESIVSKLGFILFATVVASSSRCIENPKSVSYEVSATVGVANDLANPLHSSSDHLFPNIPDFQVEKKKKKVDIPLTGYFQVNCNSVMMIGSQRFDYNASMSSDKGDITLLYKRNRDGSFTLDDSKALKVDRKQYHDTIQKIIIRVDDSIIKSTDNRLHNDPETSSLIEDGQRVEAYKFRVGDHQASCEFISKDGKSFTDTASVRVLDNRI